MAESMRIRARLEGDYADVKVLIRHPMETGQRKDADGKLVPLHYITQVTATHNGKVVMDAKWSQAVSRDPFLGFRVKGAKAGDTIVVNWVDNKGGKSSVSTKVAGS